MTVEERIADLQARIRTAMDSLKVAYAVIDLEAWINEPATTEDDFALWSEEMELDED